MFVVSSLVNLLRTVEGDKLENLKQSKKLKTKQQQIYKGSFDKSTSGNDKNIVVEANTIF